jgi:hypothetical protein
MASYGLDDHGSVPGMDKRLFFTASIPGLGPLSSLLSSGYLGHFPGGKATGALSYHSTPFTAEAKTCGSIPPVYHAASWYCARHSFTLTLLKQTIVYRQKDGWLLMCQPAVTGVLSRKTDSVLGRPHTNCVKTSIKTWDKSWHQHHDSDRCAAVFVISFVSTLLLSLRHVADIVSWLLHVLTHAGVRPNLGYSLRAMKWTVGHGGKYLFPRTVLLFSPPVIISPMPSIITYHHHCLVQLSSVSQPPSRGLQSDKGWEPLQ